MIKIPLYQLHEVARDRPAGYVEDVSRLSKIDGEVLYLQPADYISLVRKYSPDKLILFSKPIPRNEWPIWAKALVILSKPEDKGIGDVVARTIGAENSEAFKKFFKATFGKDCGCAGRHRQWNLKYPLP